MIISSIPVCNIGCSCALDTLKRHMVANTSIFGDFETHAEGWFCSSFCTLSKWKPMMAPFVLPPPVHFTGDAKALIDDYYAPLLIGQDLRRHEFLWQRMYCTPVRLGRSGSSMCGLSAPVIAL
jgi:hypothetical protein